MPVPCISLSKLSSSIRLVNRYFARHFHLQPLNFYSYRHVYACNVKIGALSRAGKIETARQLFDKMSSRDVVSWNSIITGYWQNGCLKETKCLFEVMPTKNVVSWNSLIAGCVKNERIDDALMYFNMMPHRNTASWNVMISGFVKYGRIEEAKILFEQMPRKNVISYTAMIDGHVKNGMIEQARKLFDSMPLKNSVSWTVMINGYLENGGFEEAKELFDQMPDKNVVAFTAMITGFCKEGKMETARSLFDEIQFKDCISYNALIAGYAQNGPNTEALKLLVEMLRRSMEPDQYTLVSVLSACSNLAILKEGKQTHSIVLKKGLDSHISICNAIVIMYGKCGVIMDSELAFRQIKTHDLVSWNTMISAYSNHGLYEKVVSFFKQMRINGAQPDGVTFLSLLSACGHSGMVNESVFWFSEMEKNYGIAPRTEHYACLVDILGRAGLVEKGYEMIQKMPFEADSGLWGALLSGSRACLNVELGEVSAKRVVELDPNNSGAYVVLSNIYAALGMWKEVTEVRGLMREKGVKKQPAYSWMELGNGMHCFLGGDVSHPEIRGIHLELKKIYSQMKVMDEIEEIVSTWSCFG